MTVTELSICIYKHSSTGQDSGDFHDDPSELWEAPRLPRDLQTALITGGEMEQE